MAAPKMVRGVVAARNSISVGSREVPGFDPERKVAITVREPERYAGPGEEVEVEASEAKRLFERGVLLPPGTKVELPAEPQTAMKPEDGPTVLRAVA